MSRLGPVGSDSEGTIEVFQDRQWAGDRRLGTFTVYVDGKRVGIVRPLSTIRVPLPPGVHCLRIRQWWYRSTRVEVKVEEGVVIRLKAGVPKGRESLRLLFHPSASLTLVRT